MAPMFDGISEQQYRDLLYKTKADTPKWGSRLLENLKVVWHRTAFFFKKGEVPTNQCLAKHLIKHLESCQKYTPNHLNINKNDLHTLSDIFKAILPRIHNQITQTSLRNNYHYAKSGIEKPRRQKGSDEDTTPEDDRSGTTAGDDGAQGQGQGQQAGGGSTPIVTPTPGATTPVTPPSITIPSQPVPTPEPTGPLVAPAGTVTPTAPPAQPVVAAPEPSKPVVEPSDIVAPAAQIVPAQPAEPTPEPTKPVAAPTTPAAPAQHTAAKPTYIELLASPAKVGAPLSQTELGELLTQAMQDEAALSVLTPQEALAVFKLFKDGTDMSISFDGSLARVFLSKLSQKQVDPLILAYKPEYKELIRALLLTNIYIHSADEKEREKIAKILRKSLGRGFFPNENIVRKTLIASPCSGWSVRKWRDIFSYYAVRNDALYEFIGAQELSDRQLVAISMIATSKVHSTNEREDLIKYTDDSNPIFKKNLALLERSDNAHAQALYYWLKNIHYFPVDNSEKSSLTPGALMSATLEEIKNAFSFEEITTLKLPQIKAIFERIQPSYYPGMVRAFLPKAKELDAETAAFLYLKSKGTPVRKMLLRQLTEEQAAIILKNTKDVAQQNVIKDLLLKQTPVTPGGAHPAALQSASAAQSDTPISIVRSQITPLPLAASPAKPTVSPASTLAPVVPQDTWDIPELTLIPIQEQYESLDPSDRKQFVSFVAEKIQSQESTNENVTELLSILKFLASKGLKNPYKPFFAKLTVEQLAVLANKSWAVPYIKQYVEKDKLQKVNALLGRDIFKTFAGPGFQDKKKNDLKASAVAKPAPKLTPAQEFESLCKQYEAAPNNYNAERLADFWDKHERTGFAFVVRDALVKMQIKEYDQMRWQIIFSSYGVQERQNFLNTQPLTHEQLRGLSELFDDTDYPGLDQLAKNDILSENKKRLAEFPFDAKPALLLANLPEDDILKPFPDDMEEMLSPLQKQTLSPQDVSQLITELTETLEKPLANVSIDTSNSDSGFWDIKIDYPKACQIVQRLAESNANPKDAELASLKEHVARLLGWVSFEMQKEPTDADTTLDQQWDFDELEELRDYLATYQQALEDIDKPLIKSAADYVRSWTSTIGSALASTVAHATGAASSVRTFFSQSVSKATEYDKPEVNRVKASKYESLLNNLGHSIEKHTRIPAPFVGDAEVRNLLKIVMDAAKKSETFDSTKKVPLDQYTGTYLDSVRTAFDEALGAMRLAVVRCEAGNVSPSTAAIVYEAAYNLYATHDMTKENDNLLHLLGVNQVDPKNPADSGRLVESLFATREVIQKAPVEKKTGKWNIVARSAVDRFSLGFSAIGKGNPPFHANDVQIGGQKISLLRMGSPTIQYWRMLGVTNPNAESEPLFRGYLHHLEALKKKHLYISNQNDIPTPFVTLHDSENFRNSALKETEKLPAFYLIICSKDSRFYAGHGPDDIEEFKEELHKQFFGYKPEESGCYIGDKIKAEVPDLEAKLKSMRDKIQQHLFKDVHQLTEQDRRRYIAIYYMLTVLMNTKELGIDFANFTCKDGIDRGMDSLALFLFLCLAERTISIRKAQSSAAENSLLTGLLDKKAWASR